MRTMMIGLMMTMAGASGAAKADCDSTDAAKALDFWLGDWTVSVGENQVGKNGIVKTLKGCAVFEHWENRAGNQGKSLFYFDAVADSWSQVWVTEDTSRPGGLKHKDMIAFSDGMVRFRGQLEHPTRGAYLDQTTLTRQADGSVRQLIEISFDDGASWQTTFDALYRRPEVP